MVPSLLCLNSSFLLFSKNYVDSFYYFLREPASCLNLSFLLLQSNIFMLKPTPNLYPSSLWDHLVGLVLQFRMLFTGLMAVLRLRFLYSWAQWNYGLLVAPSFLWLLRPFVLLMSTFNLLRPKRSTVWRVLRLDKFETSFILFSLLIESLAECRYPGWKKEIPLEPPNMIRRLYLRITNFTLRV